MLLLVSPLLGFSVIAQHAIAQYIVMVIVTFWCCFLALKIPVIATQLAACWSSKDLLSACSWFYPVPPFFVLFVGLPKVRCQPTAGSRDSQSSYSSLPNLLSLKLYTVLHIPFS
ncbi:hypothetical protein CHARACLAT_028879, partial [Characodon lateralis]|nr:hypothetical protein [Characodon lateralis]